MNKPLLHLFPGFGGSGLFFKWLQEALAPDVETITHVIPRHGPQDYDALTRHFAPQIDRPCFLLGESFSGPLTILLAKALPDRVHGLILSTSFAKSPYPPMIRELMVVGARFRSYLPFRKIFSNLSLIQGAPHPKADEIEAVMQQLSPEILRTRTRACVHVDVSQALATLNQPVLIFKAKKDRAIGTGNFYPGTINQCHTIEMDCGHLLLQSKPREAATEIKNFISKIG